MVFPETWAFLPKVNNSIVYLLCNEYQDVWKKARTSLNIITLFCMCFKSPIILIKMPMHKTNCILISKIPLHKSILYYAAKLNYKYLHRKVKQKLTRLMRSTWPGLAATLNEWANKVSEFCQGSFYTTCRVRCWCEFVAVVTGKNIRQSKCAVSLVCVAAAL